MAMDPECVVKCGSKPIHQFGAKRCTAKCKKSSMRTLTDAQRQVILFSMVFIENKNTHPDVREQLWLRASGAYQLMESYKDYKVEVDSSNSTKNVTDYYEALEKSPTPPNPSVCTIKAD